MESALVEPCKDRLDRVHFGLQVCQVVDNFGRYLKYAVTDAAVNSSPATSVSMRGRGNAFEILMGSARTLQSKTLPDSVQEKNKKDKLYNNFLLMYRSQNLQMRADEVDSIRVKVT